MSEFILLMAGFFLGVGFCRLFPDRVSIRLKVDAKEAIKDLNEATDAVKELRKQMNI